MDAKSGKQLSLLTCPLLGLTQISPLRAPQASTCHGESIVPVSDLTSNSAMNLNLTTH
jgi:hypothetical protein